MTYVFTTLYFLGWIYVVTCTVLRCVFANDIADCDSKYKKADVKLAQLSIATILMALITVITSPSLKKNGMFPITFICLICLVTTLSLSMVHIFLYDEDGLNVTACSVNVIAINVLLSLGAYIFGLIFIGGFITFSCINIVMMLYKIFKMTWRGKIILIVFSWCICQIVLLAIYPCENYVKGLASCELIVVFFLLRFFSKENYSEIHQWVHLACVFGFLCLLIEKTKTGEISPVSINSSLLLIVPASYFFLVLKKIINRKEETQVESFVVEMENGPPAIYASGSSAVYKKVIFL